MTEFPRFYIGSMSKNVVDAVVEFVEESGGGIGFISSRRQIEHDGGYVNNWTTEEFSRYVSGKVITERDHGGCDQGYTPDDGMKSFAHDAKHLDIIHVDPWKKYPEYQVGLKKTVEYIKKIYGQNPKTLFEVGTEEAIRKFTPDELESLLKDLSVQLSTKMYENIKYAVVQSGVGLDLGSMKNTGNYDPSRLQRMIDVCNRFEKKSKEHNGDYLGSSDYEHRFKLGLDAINIAPEFGQIETMVYLENMNKNAIDAWYDICLKSKRWEKWVDKTFDRSNKIKLIQICGHYTFSNEMFQSVKPAAIDELVVSVIKEKLGDLNAIQ